jgi:hypothetical protein
MPRMDEVLHRVSNAKYVSEIDMTKSYWQVPFDEDAKRKSALVTPFGQYQFSVMPWLMLERLSSVS